MNLCVQSSGTVCNRYLKEKEIKVILFLNIISIIIRLPFIWKDNFIKNILETNISLLLVLFVSMEGQFTKGILISTIWIQ